MMTHRVPRKRKRKDTISVREMSRGSSLRYFISGLIRPRARVVSKWHYVVPAARDTDRMKMLRKQARSARGCYLISAPLCHDLSGLLSLAVASVIFRNIFFHLIVRSCRVGFIFSPSFPRAFSGFRAVKSRRTCVTSA